MSDPLIDRLIPDRSEFFERNFGRHPVVVKGALADLLPEMLSLRDLDDALHSEAISPAHLRITRAGEPVPSTAFTVKTPVQGSAVVESVDPRRAYSLLDQGATLTWDAVNHFHAPTRRLASALASEFGTRAAVSAFVTPAGTQGFKVHHDPVDVFAAQLAGTKRWMVWALERPIEPGSVAQYDQAELGAPLIDTVLEPGDVLYMPAGVPHAAIAQDQLSLHLSLAVSPRTWADILGEVTKEILQDEAFWAFPFLGEGEDPHLVEALREKLAVLAGRIGEYDPAVGLRQAVASGRDQVGTAFEHRLARENAADTLTAGTALTLAPVPTAYGSEADGRVEVTVADRVLAVPTVVADALRAAPARAAFRAEDIAPGASEEQAVKVASALVRAGLLVLH